MPDDEMNLDHSWVWTIRNLCPDGTSLVLEETDIDCIANLLFLELLTGVSGDGAANVTAFHFACSILCA